MKFDLDYLFQALEPFTSGQAFMLGFSGGIDSVVLLNAIKQLILDKRLEVTLRAMHVDHGLQPHSRRDHEFCARFCEEHEVTFIDHSLGLNARESPKYGIENLAREARYQAFESQLQKNEVLLLAHHLDDQLETLLFRLNRGANLKGLIGIPKRRKFAAGEIFRPLLEVTRRDLLKYAKQRGLRWVEDKSNKDVQFDRNFLRHKVMPAIESRWPRYRSSWHKSLQLLDEAHVMLRDLAEADLKQLRFEGSHVISINSLRKHSKARQRNLICHWIELLGLPALSWNRLHKLVDEFIATNSEAGGLVVEDGYQIGRFRNRLYVLTLQPLPASNQQWLPGKNSKITIKGSGTLIGRNTVGCGITNSLVDRLEVRFRQGGEACRLQGRPKKTLKKLLHEARMEPWWRDRIPLIYSDNELICIPGIGVCEGAAAAPSEHGIEVIWKPSEELVT